MVDYAIALGAQGLPGPPGAEDLIGAIEPADVRWFGAIGDGSADDTAALAMAYSSSPGGVLIPPGIWTTAAEIDTNNVPTFGFGRASRIVATAAMRSVFDLNGQHNAIRGLEIDANDLADHCVHVGGCNSSYVGGNWLEGGKRGGIYYPAIGNNNNGLAEHNVIKACGTSWATGTAAASSGGTTATLTGAPDLTTLGLRPYMSSIRLAGDIFRTIVSVTATTVTVSSGTPFPATVSGVAYTITDGTGIGIDLHPDNSAIASFKNNVQAITGTAIRDCALFGGRHRDNIVEVVSGHGLHIGLAHADNACQGVEESGGHYEALGSKTIYVERAVACRLNPAFMDQGLAGIEINDHLGGAYIAGLEVAYAGARTGGYCPTHVNVPSGSPVGVPLGGSARFVQSPAASDFTINLPAITQDVANGLDAQVQLILLDLGGRTATVKTTDSSTVNGVAGTTGVALTGSYRTAIARWAPGYGWALGLTQHQAQAAVADAAALTSVDGTGAAGATPTQAEFNALVAEFNKLRTDLAAVRTPLNSALARLRTAGAIAP